jgi:eukaryotic-like serine/threonine-protein kinase
MPLPSGTKLGPYEILTPLGAGGMGEVYRARDTRLGRDVAIKVLPEALANDADRLRRLEQEAKTIAALNHPNIVGIHDIGSQETRRYLVSELLEGQTLREALGHGALPLKRVIEYAQAIAKGLGAAHEKGIVHRDLKPENIFITKDGRVKILDFGLAKLVQPEEDLGAAVTMTSPATAAGMVMGTIGYMSPEQVRGAASDARSDIFSFGVVLYEMLTGKRAFKRDTAAETMTAILREEPPELTETGWQGPLGLQKILGRCLEKSPERRFQSASDLGFAIEALSGSTAGIGTQAHAAIEVKRSWWPWAAGALGVLALGVGAWMEGKSSAVKTQPRFTRLTYQQGYLTNARFAKDGGTIAYSAQWGNEPLCVYTVRTEFPQSTKAELPNANLLALSPSGDMELSVDPVYHTNFIDGTLAQAQMMGGTPRGLENNAISADYAPDGKTLAVARVANQKVQLEYPQGKVIYTTSGYLDYLRVSPSGKEIAFLEHPVFDDDRGWVAVIDEAGNRKQLTKEFATVQGLVWSRRGQELWYTAADASTDRSLRGVTMSGNTREILAVPRSLRLLDIAGDGRVLVASEELRSEVRAIDPATGKERNGLEWFNGSGLADISSDGKAILYSEWGGPAGELYLVVYRKTDGSAPTSLGEGTDPKFSPDGTIAAAPVLSRPPKLALHPIGTGESKRLELGEMVALTHLAWFPNGNHVLLLGATSGEALRTYEMDLAGGKPVAVGPAGFLGFAVANDGKRIFGRNGAGQAVVFDKETQNMKVVPGIGVQEQIQKWTEDGQALLTTSATPWEAEMYRVDVATGKRTLLQKVQPIDKAGSTINLRVYYAERSRTYAYNTRRIVSILYAVEGL